MSSEIKFENVPDNRQAEREHQALVEVITEDKHANEDLSVDVTVELYKGTSASGSPTDSVTSTITEGDSLSAALDVSFESPGDYRLSSKGKLDYYGASGYSKGTVNETVTTDSQTFTIVAFEEETEDVEVGGAATFDSYRNAYDDRASVRLTNIVPTEGTELSFEQIDFSPYNNPNVAIDSSARYASHEIIGGTTVRQKIGEEPTDVSISGVCTEDVAKRVDELRKVSYLDVIGGRFTSGITCQVGSTSTEPLEDGGVADMDRGDFLYDFNINLVEISPNELQQT